MKELIARASRKHHFRVFTGGLISSEDVVKTMLLSMAGVAEVYPDLTERQVIDMSVAAIKLSHATMWIEALPNETGGTRERFDPSQPHSEILAERDGSGIRFFFIAPLNS